jgi:hypothetical protein
VEFHYLRGGVDVEAEYRFVFIFARGRVAAFYFVSDFYFVDGLGAAVGHLDLRPGDKAAALA